MDRPINDHYVVEQLRLLIDYLKRLQSINASRHRAIAITHMEDALFRLEKFPGVEQFE